MTNTEVVGSIVESGTDWDLSAAGHKRTRRPLAQVTEREAAAQLRPQRVRLLITEGHRIRIGVAEGDVEQGARRHRCDRRRWQWIAAASVQ